ncbi:MULTISPECIES: hypothetical protein [unclassified Mesorhizobium]|uniref:hypothetical protein n=1 Tax=unclassified Mesorhizobium TaxID=325217 RepID=UPI0026C6B0DA
MKNFLLGGPRIAAGAELKPNQWRDVRDALILARRKRDRVAEVQCLRVGFIDQEQPLVVLRFPELLADRGTKGGKQPAGDMLLDISHQVVDELT